jgi:ABC-2 type transport system ATP-binding protein
MDDGQLFPQQPQAVLSDLGRRARRRNAQAIQPAARPQTQPTFARHEDEGSARLVTAYRPTLIILDEPFSGLDPLVRDEFIESLLESAAGPTIFISSHDLAGIESFSSHVGYLDQGHLQFSEESAALAARFREIEVTLTHPILPANVPDSWLCVETSPSVIRFVETRFDEVQTNRQIATLFPSAQSVNVNPMPLREIFIALAKTLREAA